MLRGNQVDPLDHQSRNAVTLGRKQVVPHIAQPAHRHHSGGLVDRSARALQVPHHGLDGLGAGEHAADLGGDGGINVGSGQAEVLLTRGPEAHRRLGDVVLVPVAVLLSGVGRVHGIAGGCKEQPPQQRVHAGAHPGTGGTGVGIGCQHRVDLVPKTAIDDRLVGAGMPAALQGQLPQVDLVAQQAVEVLLVDAGAGSLAPFLGGPGFGGDPAGRQLRERWG